MAGALDRQIRKSLEKAVREARSLAEDGARKALTALGVEDARRPTGLAEADIHVRNRLRAHARALGDIMASDDSIKANRLVREIAYEHWHRALFARFLAENNLLIDPEHKVAVSLSDLEEIAKEEGRDPAELAAEWAEPMLPQIFRKDDPALALALPPEIRAGITDIVKRLPRAVFAADDSLGWVYQFWQADEKERINKSGDKIGADELPAVTQLFTEDYMVLFLLENTLGAWWAGKALAADPDLAAGAATEEDLREKTSPAGYRWTYLRFVREPRDGETHDTATGPWRPAAGAFEGWPKAARDITVLDPCMGSGHFLVFALPILLAFRRAEEGLDERAAVKGVLADNLLGLEIDPRCTQIAAFALALASWKRLGGPEPLPRLNLACSGLAIGLGKAEFLRLAERITAKWGWKANTHLLGDGATPIESAAIGREREGLSRLYDLFDKAPYLGSLINPRQFGSDIFASSYDDVATVLGEILQGDAPDLESIESAVTAQGLAKAAEILVRHCTLVATNVPFLGAGRQHDQLTNQASLLYPRSNGGLAAAFVEKFCLADFADTFSLVTQQNWLELTTFDNLRLSLLSSATFDLLARLGSRAFETIGGERVSVYLCVLRDRPNETDNLRFIEASGLPRPAEKAREVALGPVSRISQKAQRANPGYSIIFDPGAVSTFLGAFAECYQAISTGDAPRYVKRFWELPSLSQAFVAFQRSPARTAQASGKESIIDCRDIKEGRFAAVRGAKAWDRTGIVISQVSNPSASLYFGEYFADSSPVIIPHNRSDLAAIWSFVSSGAFVTALRKFNSKMSINNGYVSKVPFDANSWRTKAQAEHVPGWFNPYSNDPTQWLFDGHPRGSANPSVARDSGTNLRLITLHGVRPGMAEHPLQVAVARLLGYRWPRQTGSSFMDCPALTEPDDADRSGLVDAHGIVPLPALDGKADAATRLRDLIRAVWGPDYTEDAIRGMLTAERAKAADLGTWLADEFFDGHCRLFHQTPFIWHIWDGARGGFSALVNSHRLCEGNGAGRRLLEKLRDSYLGEWIGAQRRSIAAGEAGAEVRLIAAEHLRGELTKIIEGDPPYDIFVRWKPLDRQPIGWEPDLNDGVCVNSRPFIHTNLSLGTPRSASALRVAVAPGSSRDTGGETRVGREVADFPWFWAEDDDVAITDFAGGSEFKGRRYNDFHYSRAFKQRARVAKGNPSEGEAA